MRERLDAVLHDVGSSAAPAGMKETDGAGRVGDKDGNAVRDRHRENQTPVDGDVSVDGVDAQPAFPPRTVNDHPAAVHLRRMRQSASFVAQLLAQSDPSRNHLAHRLGATEAEAAGRACRREGADAEGSEFVDNLRVGQDGHPWRRSSTRSMLAPSARKRSSMRS